MLQASSFLTRRRGRIAPHDPAGRSGSLASALVCGGAVGRRPELDLAEFDFRFHADEVEQAGNDHQAGLLREFGERGGGDCDLPGGLGGSSSGGGV